MILPSLGIVLRRRRHLEEDSRVVVLLREEGKVILAAKGGQRLQSRLKSALEPCAESDFEVYLPPHGVYGKVIGARLVRSRTGLRVHYDRFQTACRMTEALDALLPARAPAPQAYEVLRNGLDLVDAGGSPYGAWCRFGLNLLRVLGHGDQTDRLLSLLPPADVERARSAFGGPASEVGTLPDAALRRSVSFVNGELDRILPRQLKAELPPAAAEPSGNR